MTTCSAMLERAWTVLRQLRALQPEWNCDRDIEALRVIAAYGAEEQRIAVRPSAPLHEDRP